MNQTKALEKAEIWINQKPSPPELIPKDVWDVLEGLGFELKGKSSDHTTFIWFHKHLLINEPYFKFGIVSLSVGHAQGKKTVIRVDSVKKIINALNTFIENEKK